MGRPFVSYYFDGTTGNPYLTDAGLPKKVYSKISIPPDWDEAQTAAIAIAAGAEILLTGDKPPGCDNTADGSRFDPRKLVFEMMPVGNKSISRKMEVTLRDRSQLIAIAGSLRDTIIAQGYTVRCIKLVGEKFTNLWYDFSNTPPVGTIAAKLGTDIFAPLYEYEADALNPFGTEILLKARISSDLVNAMPSLFANVGAFEAINVPGCAAPNTHKPRRFIIKTAWDDNGVIAPQKTELPQADSDPVEITQTAVALTGVANIICLGYRGEDSSRVARLL